jgi:hypothetical protein
MLLIVCGIAVSYGVHRRLLPRRDDLARNRQPRG